MQPTGLYPSGFCQTSQQMNIDPALVYKFKFDLQPGSLTNQVAGEHQP